MDDHMTAIAFDTARLMVRPWHTPPGEDWPDVDLEKTVAGMLTAEVTRYLPAAWSEDVRAGRVREWIENRDREGHTLLAVDRLSREPVGLLILAELTVDDQRVDLRFGYLLAETRWGEGFGTELLEGLVRWSRSRPRIASLTGGVARENAASRRVLEKLGFIREEVTEPDRAETPVYRLEVS